VTRIEGVDSETDSDSDGLREHFGPGVGWSAPWPGPGVARSGTGIAASNGVTPCPSRTRSGVTRPRSGVTPCPSPCRVLTAGQQAGRLSTRCSNSSPVGHVRFISTYHRNARSAASAPDPPFCLRAIRKWTIVRCLLKRTAPLYTVRQMYRFT
jgi:hypothetical protein